MREECARLQAAHAALQLVLGFDSSKSKTIKCIFLSFEFHRDHHKFRRSRARLGTRAFLISRSCNCNNESIMRLRRGRYARRSRELTIMLASL